MDVPRRFFERIWLRTATAPTGRPAKGERTVADNLQPVGYSCKKCGGMLYREERTADAPVQKCCRCWRWFDEAEDMPPWVQPGPRPGPWQETHDWTGEYRSPAEGEWYTSTWMNWKPAQWSGGGCGPRHILRPKAKEPEATTCAVTDSLWSVSVDSARPGGDKTCLDIIDEKGRVEMTATWDRALTKDELQQFHDDPYTFLQNRKDALMADKKRSLPVRMMIAAATGLLAWAGKTVLTGGLALLLYHHWGWCWAFVQDPAAVLQPAWDATASFAAAKLPYAAAFTGIAGVAYLFGRIRRKA